MDLLVSGLRRAADPRGGAAYTPTVPRPEIQNGDFSSLYDLPFGRGKKLGSDTSQIADAVIGGWQVNGVLSFRGGRSSTLGTRYGVGYIGSIHPDCVAEGRDSNAPPPGGRTTNQWFDTSAVQAPAPYTIEKVPNATNVGPRERNADVALFKAFRVTERYRPNSAPKG